MVPKGVKQHILTGEVDLDRTYITVHPMADWIVVLGSVLKKSVSD
jgi:hypothetical protein